MQARSHHQLFLHNYVVIFRCIKHISNAGDFEITEINNIFKCLGGLDELKVRTLRGRGYLEKIITFI